MDKHKRTKGRRIKILLKVFIYIQFKLYSICIYIQFYMIMTAGLSKRRILPEIFISE